MAEGGEGRIVRRRRAWGWAGVDGRWVAGVVKRVAGSGRRLGGERGQQAAAGR